MRTTARRALRQQVRPAGRIAKPGTRLGASLAPSARRLFFAFFFWVGHLLRPRNLRGTASKRDPEVDLWRLRARSQDDPTFGEERSFAAHIPADSRQFGPNADLQRRGFDAMHVLTSPIVAANPKWLG